MRNTLAIVICLSLLGCVTEPEVLEDDFVSPAVMSTPLELDPTEEISIGRWWTNGRELLRLDADAGFKLYSTLNRYHKPRERGRWTQQSYALLWLEPYSLLPHERVRVRINKINSELALNIPKLDPFFAIEEPPAVTEDAMFGMWYGPLGALGLTNAMRYSFTPDSVQTAPIVIVGHKGSWRLSGSDIIKLMPDTMGLGPYRLQLVDADDRLLLVTPEGDFEHDLPENRGE